MRGMAKAPTVTRPAGRARNIYAADAKNGSFREAIAAHRAYKLSATIIKEPAA